MTSQLTLCGENCPDAGSCMSVALNYWLVAFTQYRTTIFNSAMNVESMMCCFWHSPATEEIVGRLSLLLLVSLVPDAGFGVSRSNFTTEMQSVQSAKIADSNTGTV
jgi:hypothetical protein